ncbi:MAG: class B sortase [Eubacterium sp.]|jgi:sortase B|nr:class B sortase [Eubacterium sp.]
MKKHDRFQFIRIILLAILIICLVKIGQTYYLSVQHKKQAEELKQGFHTKKPSAKTTRQDHLQKLAKKNADLIGWLKIEGTKIDYPVMQCQDDNYYLSHDFYKNESRYGCLYVKQIADVTTPDTNFIIYGHNMKDGSMFGELDQYKIHSFYDTHSEIEFDTLSETRQYEILAAFPTQISNQKDNFQYYEFYHADTEKEFQDFYQNIKKLSLYDTGKTAEWTDTFLTLSTCDNHTEDGRFVIVAKRKKN